MKLTIAHLFKSAMAPSINYMAPSINYQTTQIPLELTEHFVKRLGLGETFNAVCLSLSW